MPELRKDPVAGHWVIMAQERAKRPDEFAAGDAAPKPASPNCPFCEGKEGKTPPEIRAVRQSGEANSPGWRVRVVPNKFPALRIEGELERRGDGVYDLITGIGAHEVIIESPRHHLSISELEVDEVREVLAMYRERLTDLRRDPRLAYGLVFKNVGESAGASLEHTHSQLIVTPVVPAQVQGEMDRCRHYHGFRGRCLLCDMVQQELSSSIRVVVDSPNFLSFAPFASRVPFETHVLPKRHESHYEDLPGDRMTELAEVLRTTLRKIEGAIRTPPYNYLLHTAPLNSGPLEYYHWHLEIIPRITRVAGFEWGTGFYINPVPPEHAAQFLREVKV